MRRLLAAGGEGQALGVVRQAGNSAGTEALPNRSAKSNRADAASSSVPPMQVTCMPGSSKAPGTTGPMALVQAATMSAPPNSASGVATATAFSPACRARAAIASRFSRRRAVKPHLAQLPHRADRVEMRLRHAAGAENAEHRRIRPRQQPHAQRGIAADPQFLDQAVLHDGEQAPFWMLNSRISPMNLPGSTQYFSLRGRPSTTR